MHTHTCSLIHTRSLTHADMLTHAHTFMHMLTHIYSHTLTYILTQGHTYIAYTHSHMLKLPTHGHTCSHSSLMHSNNAQLLTR